MTPEIFYFWIFLCAAVLSHGFFLAVILLVLRKGDGRANRYLAMILTVFWFSSAHLVIRILDMEAFFRPVRFAPTLLWMVFPPLIYFYTRLACGADLRLSWRSIAHFIPMAVIACDMTFLHPWVRLVEEELSPGNHHFAERMMYNLLYTVQSVVYLILSMGIVRSGTATPVVKILLVAFVADTVIGFTAASYQFVTHRPAPHSLEIATVIFAFLVYGFSYVAIRGSGGLFSRRTANGTDAAGAGTIIDRFKVLMEKEKLYRDCNLRYSDVAARLGVSARALSSALNNVMGRTFNDVVNTYRVQEAQELMSRPSDYTLLGIAFTAGFNSKSSFNRVFKQLTGMTPSAYVTARRGNGDENAEVAAKRRMAMV